MPNVCMFEAMARWHEFEVHVRGALNNGVTSEEIAEILLHTAVYAGIPIASEGFRRADGEIKAVAAARKTWSRTRGPQTDRSPLAGSVPAILFIRFGQGGDARSLPGGADSSRGRNAHHLFESAAVRRL